MELTARICLGLFGLVSLAVGLRLLMMARRTRQLPEFLVGLAFLTGGLLGRGPVVAAVSATSLPEVLRVALFMGGRFLTVICCLSIGLMAWRVFQRDQAWAKALFLVLLAVLAVDCAIDVFALRPGAVLHDNVGFWIGISAKTFAFAWVSWEALRYYAILRRRIPLGLADPVVANRIVLWGVAAGLMGSMFPVTSLAQMTTGLGERDPALMMIQSVTGLAVLTCVILAFFPPRAYVERIARRATRQES